MRNAFFFSEIQKTIHQKYTLISWDFPNFPAYLSQGRVNIMTDAETKPTRLSNKIFSLFSLPQKETRAENGTGLFPFFIDFPGVLWDTYFTEHR